MTSSTSVMTVEESKSLLELSRAKGVDVIFTKVLYHKHGKDGGVFAMKVPVLRTMTEDNPLTEIVPEMQVPCALGRMPPLDPCETHAPRLRYSRCRRTVATR